MTIDDCKDKCGNRRQYDVMLLLLQDEREVKRQRRKQSNRESARRSRLRKQAECEALAVRVNELMNENVKLRAANEQLLKLQHLTSHQVCVALRCSSSPVHQLSTSEALVLTHHVHLQVSRSSVLLHIRSPGDGACLQAPEISKAQ